MAIAQINSTGLELIPIVFYSVYLIYLLTFLLIFRGWLQIPVFSNTSLRITVRISVIVAARNEEDNLLRLLDCLSRQDYPEERFEVIIVDDHSDIPIEQLTGIRTSPVKNLKILSLDESQHGKKQALIKGARAVDNELLLFTDADCLPGPNWLSSFAAFYEEKKTDMIIGLVDYPEDLCIPGGFYRLDFLSMIITGAGTASLGHPTLCNGANLAIRREVYLNYSDRIRPEIPSGDDIFLLHSLKKSPYNEIKILKNREALIKTDLPGSLHEFLSQRIRWASKSKYYYDRLTIFLGIIVILMNMCLLSGAVSFLTGITGINLLLIGLVVKIIADSLLLGAGLGFFKGRILLILLPIVEILYPFYILYVLIASSLNHYTWKKREY